jgi:hypothetical protein
MFSEGHKEVQDTTVRWQDHGMFWDSEGVIHVHFLPHGVTINAQYKSNVLHNDVHRVIQKKKPGKCQRISSYCLTTAATYRKVILETTVCEIMKHCSQMTWSLSDSHVSGPMSVHLGKQNFKPMMNLNVVSWTGYATRMKLFMLLALLTCKNDENNVSV